MPFVFDVTPLKWNASYDHSIEGGGLLRHAANWAADGYRAVAAWWLACASWLGPSRESPVPVFTLFGDSGLAEWAVTASSMMDVMQQDRLFVNRTCSFRSESVGILVILQEWELLGA